MDVVAMRVVRFMMGSFLPFTSMVSYELISFFVRVECAK